ncbi:hypothetical protein DPMN_080360 [Dreissena polymorpha]|uniref:Uncharacterized protein n=1 Tax=Dreissena polymorpha TaxID=45954 RepID=A0A9D3YQQ7_DREPO|nr:hypothetical protein DPMN_080360 [Dreissena polymorpha]
MDTDIRGERRGRSGEEDPSQLPRNKYRIRPETTSSPDRTGLSGMLMREYLESLLETQSPHSESM